MNNELASTFPEALNETPNELKDHLRCYPSGGAEHVRLVVSFVAILAKAVDDVLSANSVEMVITDGAMVDSTRPLAGALPAQHIYVINVMIRWKQSKSMRVDQ